MNLKFKHEREKSRKNSFVYRHQRLRHNFLSWNTVPEFYCFGDLLASFVFDFDFFKALQGQEKIKQLLKFHSSILRQEVFFLAYQLFNNEGKGFSTDSYK